MKLEEFFEDRMRRIILIVNATTRKIVKKEIRKALTIAGIIGSAMAKNGLTGKVCAGVLIRYGGFYRTKNC